MGLDMHLEKHTYLLERGALRITGNGTADIKPERVRKIVEEVGYWRKANAVHLWFVGNVQEGEDDCGTYYVGREQVAALLNLAKGVLANPQALGPELLPTTSGFFFGGTEYGEYYVEDLESTVRICEEVLAEDEGTSSLYYRSSW